ncbi:MAG: FxLYD domain-containing protein [Methanolinea sp.]|nr:FxLYD domain-containing protein [Methanolinea sp.]
MTVPRSRAPTAVLALALAVSCLLSAGCLRQGEETGTAGGNASLEIARHLGVHGDSAFLVLGEARNTGDVPVEKAVLVVDFLDADKKRVGSRAVAAPGPIPAGGSWEFEVTLEGPRAGDVRFYTVRALYR